MRRLAGIGPGIAIGAVLAAAMPAVAARPTRQLALCMAIDEPAARLICYDAALGRPEPMRPSGAPPRMLPGAPARMQPPPPVAAASPPAPSAPRVAAPRPAAGPSVIDGRIAAVAPIGNDLFRFQLADGSLWRTGEQGRPPRVGENVRIRRSVLAYYASIGGRASIGVRPIR